ncbi:putative serine/threonine-protein kinase [Paratrimastix pyriformis]|uniref:Serine/threonine-protein kinase n=1 Tax=Paratrimastix pyriformis TaxID=342808 RepID=A0ABQ8UQX3_9EUKA|nr:putative serine/threonine-protein kinase [Paratrimastix pyriformis]
MAEEASSLSRYFYAAPQPVATPPRTASPLTSPQPHKHIVPTVESPRVMPAVSPTRGPGTVLSDLRRLDTPRSPGLSSRPLLAPQPLDPYSSHTALRDGSPSSPRTRSPAKSTPVTPAAPAALQKPSASLTMPSHPGLMPPRSPGVGPREPARVTPVVAPPLRDRHFRMGAEPDVDIPPAEAAAAAAAPVEPLPTSHYYRHSRTAAPDPMQPPVSPLRAASVKPPPTPEQQQQQRAGAAGWQADGTTGWPAQAPTGPQDESLGVDSSSSSPPPSSPSAYYHPHPVAAAAAIGITPVATPPSTSTSPPYHRRGRADVRPDEVDRTLQTSLARGAIHTPAGGVALPPAAPASRSPIRTGGRNAAPPPVVVAQRSVAEAMPGDAGGAAPIPVTSTATPTIESLKDHVDRIALEEMAIPQLLPSDGLAAAPGRPIGEGAFGQVFLGTWSGRPVCLKRIKAHLGSPDVVLHLAQADLRAHEHLRVAGRGGACHPHCLTPVGLLTDPTDGSVALVVPHCAAGNLADLLAKPIRPPWPERRRMAIELVQALTFLHMPQCREWSSPRDIKPRNILLDEKGHVHLADFGFRHLRTMAAQEGGGGAAVLGTPAYLAPEVVSVCNGIYDEKSDIYSVGVILWELATLRRPFEGSSYMSPAQMMFSVVSGRRPGAIPDPPESEILLSSLKEGYAWQNPAEIIDMKTEQSIGLLEAKITPCTPAGVPFGSDPIADADQDPVEGWLKSFADFIFSIDGASFFDGHEHPNVYAEFVCYGDRVPRRTTMATGTQIAPTFTFSRHYTPTVDAAFLHWIDEGTFNVYLYSNTTPALLVPPQHDPASLPLSPRRPVAMMPMVSPQEPEPFPITETRLVSPEPISSSPVPSTPPAAPAPSPAPLPSEEEERLMVAELAKQRRERVAALQLQKKQAPPAPLISPRPAAPETTHAAALPPLGPVAPSSGVGEALLPPLLHSESVSTSRGRSAKSDRSTPTRRSFGEEALNIWGTLQGDSAAATAIPIPTLGGDDEPAKSAAVVAAPAGSNAGGTATPGAEDTDRGTMTMPCHLLFHLRRSPPYSAASCSWFGLFCVSA